MVDPISGKLLSNTEACLAHLLPKSVCAKGRTIRSHRIFDNTFGHKYEHHVANYIQNQRAGKVDVEIVVPDPIDLSKRVTSFHTKSTLNACSDTGARSGVFELQYPKGTSASWRERHVDKGRIVAVRVKGPDQIRISISMLYSGYLTVCYHLQDEYILSFGGTAIRQLLIDAVQDNLSEPLMVVSRSLPLAARGFGEMFGRQNVGAVLHKAVELDPNPLLILSYGGKKCLMAVLPYDPSLSFLVFLPGFGPEAIDDWLEVLGGLASQTSAAIQGVIFTPIAKGQSVKTKWDGSIRFLDDPTRGRESETVRTA